MKIIVAGNGKVGEAVTRQLTAEGHSLTVIDSDQEVLENSVERYDVMTVEGNCASMGTLIKAGIKDANILIAAAGADEINLLSSMTAHSLNPDLHTIARVRNPDYRRQIYKMRESFGLSMSVNPELSCAVEITRLLRYPAYQKRDTLAKGRVEIVELRIGSGSKICDLPIKRLDSVIGTKVLICTVLRNNDVLTPDGNFILREHDRIFVTAPSQNLELMLKNLRIITHKAKNVMLAGGGTISFYLAQMLQNNGMHVTLLERYHDRCVELTNLLRNVDVIQADVSLQESLLREGLDDCDALVTLTGLDELNMIVSMFGDTRNVPQIITKLGRMENIDMVNSLPLGNIVCPKELCCQNIVRYIRAIGNKTGEAIAVHNIADGKAEAIEFRVDARTRNCGVMLRNLRLKKGIIIACITHGPDFEIPNGDSIFDRGDSIIVVSNRTHTILHLNDIFA